MQNKVFSLQTGNTLLLLNTNLCTGSDLDVYTKVHTNWRMIFLPRNYFLIICLKIGGGSDFLGFLFIYFFLKFCYFV